MTRRWCKDEQKSLYKPPAPPPEFKRTEPNNAPEAGMPCDMDTGLGEGLCCDIESRVTREGPQEMSRRWCKADDKPLYTPPDAPKQLEKSKRNKADKADMPCDIDTGLADGLCCDPSTRRTVAGETRMSSRWCAKDEVLYKPPPAPKQFQGSEPNKAEVVGVACDAD